MTRAARKDQPTLLTSWDDGSFADLRLARLLAEHGYRGTFFATTGPSGSRELTDTHIRELIGLGHELANHGWTHRPMPLLTDHEIEEEIDRGTMDIARFMVPSNIVAPPGGLIDVRVISVLRKRGLRIRTAPIIARAHPSRGAVEPTAQIFPHSRFRTALHQLKRRCIPAWPVAVRWYSSSELFRRLTRLISDERFAPPVIHLWGHSREIDDLKMWDDLEQLLHLASATGLAAATLQEYYSVSQREL